MGAKVLKFQAKGSNVEDMTISEIQEIYRQRKRALRYQLDQLEEQRRALVGERRAADADMGDLEPYMKGLAPGTQRAYRGELNRADAYFEKEGKEISDDTLPEYLLWRHKELGHAPTSIALGARALTWRAKKLGEENPFGEKSKSIMQYIKREGMSRGRGKVEALLGEDVEKMERVCEEDNNLLGLRDLAMIRLAFDAALRISEVSALRFDDVAKGPDGRARVFVQSSKTDQNGVGVHVPTTERTFGLVEQWKWQARISEGALFRIVRAEGVGPRALGKRAVADAIKRRAKQAGITKRVSGHSLRRGCAQQMTLNGVQSHKIALHCRWKSTAMLVHYSDGADVRDSAIDGLYQ